MEDDCGSRFELMTCWPLVHEHDHQATIAAFRCDSKSSHWHGIEVRKSDTIWGVVLIT
ncbi:hypothetical protein TNCV_3587321 [Trichonephila clavipes]|nr:hypothetical protein TNCV_3587321 [Trichonephila clavipes]